jgi:hypothetical protein
MAEETPPKGRHEDGLNNVRGFTDARTGSDQAGCAIDAGLGQKRGRFLVLNRCLRG